ncbi:MAG: hypothetical protein R3E79_58250 [Caldilineaceae bacterium]
MAGVEAESRAALSAEQVQAALVQGWKNELWAIIAALRGELETEPQRTPPVQELHMEVDKVGVAQQVSKITGTDYCKQLRGKANELCTIMADDHQ